jgi:serine/threonine-protein kinase RsbW
MDAEPREPAAMTSGTETAHAEIAGMPRPRCVSFSLPARPAVIPTIRNDIVALAARAGATDEQLEDIRLAVSEALTNVVVHAYPEEPGLLHVTVGVGGGELTLLIADDGCGLNTPSRHPGLGWGLALIAQAGSQFTIAQRAEGGTEARIRFPLGTGEPAPGPGRYARGSSSSATVAASSRFSTTR